MSDGFAGTRRGRRSKPVIALIGQAGSCDFLGWCPPDLSEGAFFEWQTSPDETLRRIEQEWQALGSVSLGDVCWLANTNAGDAWAERADPAARR